MLLALQDIGKAGKVPFVGFDSSQAFIDAMRSGQMQGTVLQNPFKMGALGVRTMVDHLRGLPVEKRVDTGVVLVTPTNLDEAWSRDLLKPPIDEYLK
jgi:ribose transport system substrate-binding protein